MIEFFFGCSSPWTYLGFRNIQPMAAELGVPIRWRPILVGGVFNSVKAMRGCVLLEPQGQLVPFATAVFEAYWERDADISQDAVLAQACQRSGVHADAFFAGIAQPAMFVNGDDMYFGNDRMPLVRQAVMRG